MANTVTYEARPDLQYIRMSNGLTSVFVSVLALAASELAETGRQREFAVWLASHDQLYGLGMVGFDTSELPWLSDTFADDRGFVLRAIHAAKARTGWERLGYEPHESVERCLNLFQAMVEAFSIEHASESEDAIWPHGRPAQLMLCPVHRVYQHQEGCVLCNDGPFWK